MSKGGGTTKTNSDPWVGAQPYIRQSLGMAQQVANSGGPQYYQGQATLDPNANQLGGYGQQAAFDQRVFGSPSTGGQKGGGQFAGNADFNGDRMYAGGPGGLIKTTPPGQTQGQPAAPQYSNLVGATNQLLAGGPAANLGNATAGAFGNQLGQFGGPSQIGNYGFDPTLNTQQFTPQQPGATQLGQFGFDPTLQVNQFTPQFGQAGGLDATSAYRQMLSGSPDYSSVQANADNANQQLIQQFQQNVLPQIAGRGIISGSDTGAIKSLATQLPNLATGIQGNLLAAREQERQRALGTQASAAGQVAQGGLQGYGLGLQGAQAQQGANQNLAQFGLQNAQAQAGQNENYAQRLLQGQGLGLQGAGQQTGFLQQLAQMQQQGGLANANLQGDYRNQLLGLGNLGAGLAGQAGNNIQAGVGAFPSVYQQGQAPAQNQLALGNFQQGIGQQQLTDYINQFNQQAGAPQDLATWYSQIVNGTAGLGGSATSKAPSQTDWGGIAGGLLGLALKA